MASLTDSVLEWLRLDKVLCIAFIGYLVSNSICTLLGRTKILVKKFRNSSMPEMIRNCANVWGTFVCVTTDGTIVTCLANDNSTRIEFGTAGMKLVSSYESWISFSHRLWFVGLRGRMEAGWARMNDLIVIQASQVSNPDLVYSIVWIWTLLQGLCSYVLEHVKDATSRGVVIGHDHRHNSERWAKLTAVAFVAKGMKVYLHKGLVHTPLWVRDICLTMKCCINPNFLCDTYSVPFSVRRLNAACGVMITGKWRMISHGSRSELGRF